MPSELNLIKKAAVQINDDIEIEEPLIWIPPMPMPMLVPPVIQPPVIQPQIVDPAVDFNFNDLFDGLPLIFEYDEEE